MKPDWKSAPKWAQWLAQDLNGEWWWYENEPFLNRDAWVPDGGNHEMFIPVSAYWRESLEQRPEVQQ